MKRIPMLLLSLLPFNLCSAKLRVMTTTSDLSALTREVGGELVETQSLAKGAQDPHFIEAKPSFMLDAHKTDLFIAIGLDMEIGYQGLILEGARNPKILTSARGYLDASEGIEKLELPGADVDRSMGDVHPKGNPHYWLDPYNGRVMAATIAARLAELDPANAATYQKNLQAFQLRLDQAAFGETAVEQIGAAALWEHQRKGDLTGWLSGQGKQELLQGWFGRMAPHHGVKIVTFHRSWPYFAHAFGLEIVDQLEPKPGIPPTASHLVEVIREMQRDKIRLILQERFYDTKASDLVASKTGAGVVSVANSVGGDVGVDDYIKLFDNLVQRVADVLDKKES